MRAAIATQEFHWLQARAEVTRFLAYREAQEDLQKIRSRLIRRKEFAGIVTTLSETARSHQLSLPAVDYQPESLDTKSSLSRVGLSFRVIGGYRNVREFLYDIENRKLSLLVDDVTITKPDRAELELAVRMSAYLQ